MADDAVTLTASKVELIIDDDELLNSFFARSETPRRHLAVARNTPDEQIYVELDGQHNGFRSATLTYSLRQRTVEFRVRPPESFDRSRPVHAVDVVLPSGASLPRVRKCLEAVFDLPG